MRTMIDNAKGQLRSTRRCCCTTAATIAMVISAVVSIGCGGRPQAVVHPAEGRILVGNQPIAGATVVLHLKSDVGKVPFATPRAQTDANGRFRLSTVARGGSRPAGQYVVTVVHYPLQQQAGVWTSGRNSLPSKYASRKTSDLQVQIAPGPNVLPPLVLGANGRLSNQPRIPVNRGKAA